MDGLLVARWLVGLLVARWLVGLLVARWLDGLLVARWLSSNNYVFPDSWVLRSPD